MKKIKIKNYYILACILCLNLLLQSCCDKGILYHYIDTADYYKLKKGDTLVYTNENGDTTRYIVKESNREMHWMTDQPLDECYSSEYKETFYVSFKKLSIQTDTFNNFAFGFDFFTIHWNGIEYVNNCCNIHLDSMTINDHIYKDVHLFYNKPNISYNYNYGVIQFSDSLQKTWILINNLKK